ncbi:MAG: PaaI family thioesterase [Dehalococcoidia bacterium]|jgi:uncharacterized protein (TIGR00369 family)
MTDAREGVFWDVIAGRRPLPAVLSLLGWQVLHAEPGRVSASFRGTPDFYNPGGFVQGGILAAMLDGVMGSAAVSVLGQDETVTTLDMNLSFMRPVRDVKLIAEGRVVQRGGSVVFMDGTLTLEDGSLVATATATGRIVRLSDAANREE